MRQTLSKVVSGINKIIHGRIFSFKQTFSKCYCKYTTITVTLLLLYTDNINLYLFFVNIFCNEFFCCLRDAIVQ